jgi:hypothetical protein
MAIAFGRRKILRRPFVLLGTCQNRANGEAEPKSATKEATGGVPEDEVGMRMRRSLRPFLRSKAGLGRGLSGSDLELAKSPMAHASLRRALEGVASLPSL